MKERERRTLHTWNPLHSPVLSYFHRSIAYRNPFFSLQDPRRSSISASSPLVGTPPVGTPTGASSLLVPNQVP